jgi:hypothetical protein
MLRNYIDKIYNLDSLTDEEIKTIESFTEKDKMLLINSFNKSVSNANVYILNAFDALIIDNNNEQVKSNHDNSVHDNSNIHFSNFIKEKVNSTILQKIWNAISYLCKRHEEKKGGGIALHKRGIIDKRNREYFDTSMLFH